MADGSGTSQGAASPGLSVLSFGAGAIGTYIGGSLALRGHRVVFIERPEVAAGLRQRGLRLVLDGQEQRMAQPEVAASLEEALASGPFDVGLFALKSYDTQAALETMRPFAGRLPPILCLQNGVENEAALESVLGPQKVIAGTVTSAIGRPQAGDIVLERLRGMGVAAGHPISSALVDALAAAGLHARLYARAADMKWSKLLTNLLANASAAILDLTPAQIFADRRLAALEVEQLREALRVMKRLGARVVDLPGTQVRLLAVGARLPAWLARPSMQRAVGSGRGGKMPSFHIDLHSGRGKSEVEYLNGAVARYGEQAGVPTPVNRLLTETLVALTDGTTPLETFRHRPEKLLERLGRPLPPITQ